MSRPIGLRGGPGSGVALAAAAAGLAFAAADVAAAAPVQAQAQIQAQTQGQTPAQTPAQAQVEAPSAATPPAFRGDQIALLMDALANVAADGFAPDEFTPDGLDDLLRSDNPADRERGAALLKSAILAYARAQHGGRLAPAAFDKNWGLRPAPYDPTADFDAALSQDQLSQWLAALPPPFDRYRGLKEALASYRGIAAKGGWSPLIPGPELALGASGPRVAALRRRLAAEDAQSDLDGASAAFDPPLAEAVARFQHNVGLNQSGIVDKATLAHLNIPVEQRILQIQANLERWRWAPRSWPATRIEVNIAAQEMDAFEDNGIALEMRAAPGRPDDQTPILGSQIESIVIDPPWNVPTSIATKELWPKEAAHPGYLARHGYRIISTGEGGGRRLQQKFGRTSALGRIKFDFPNSYAVYLHDTPSRAAFGRTARAVSHGCVRLQRPKELADLLFENNPQWTPQALADVIAAGDTVRIKLAAPMPIYLMYWTAFLDVKGRVNFRDDVYGWDQELMGRIAAASR